MVVEEAQKIPDFADMYHLNAPLVHMQFDLKDYENRQFENKVQLATFGLAIALFIFFFRIRKWLCGKKEAEETTLNSQEKHAKIRLEVEEENTSVWKQIKYFVPLPGLTILWFMCAVHLLFELDMLKFTAESNIVGSAGTGRTRRQTGDPQFAKGIFDQQEGYPTVTLREITYSNSLSFLYARIVHALNHTSDEEQLDKDARMPSWLNTVAPVLQSLTAICVTILLVALIFNFEEIFGPTPPDPLVVLKDEPQKEEEYVKKQKSGKQKQKTVIVTSVGGHEQKLLLSPEQVRLQEQAIAAENQKKNKLETGSSIFELQKALADKMLMFTIEYAGSNPQTDQEINGDDLYHIWLMIFLMAMCLLKLTLWAGYSILYLKVLIPFSEYLVFLPVALTFDSTELLIHSPRMLTLFSTAVLRGSHVYFYYSDDQSREDKLEGSRFHRVQYAFIRVLPFVIGMLSSTEMLIRRQLVVNLDDVIFAVPFFLASLPLFVLEELREVLQLRQPGQPSVNPKKIEENMFVNKKKDQAAEAVQIEEEKAGENLIEKIVQQVLVEKKGPLIKQKIKEQPMQKTFTPQNMEQIESIKRPQQTLSSSQEMLQQKTNESQKLQPKKQNESLQQSQKKQSEVSSIDQNKQTASPSIFQKIQLFKNPPTDLGNDAVLYERNNQTTLLPQKKQNDSFQQPQNKQNDQIKTESLKLQKKQLESPLKSQKKQVDSSQLSQNKQPEKTESRLSMEKQMVNEQQKKNQSPQPQISMPKIQIQPQTLQNQAIKIEVKIKGEGGKEQSFLLPLPQSNQTIEQKQGKLTFKIQPSKSGLNGTKEQPIDLDISQIMNFYNEQQQKQAKQTVKSTVLVAPQSVKPPSNLQRPPVRKVPYDPNLVRPATVLDKKTGQVKRNVEVHIVNLSRLVQTIPGKQVFLHMPIVFEKTELGPAEAKLCQIYAWETQENSAQHGSVPAVKFEICEIDQKTGLAKRDQIIAENTVHMTVNK